MIHNLTDSSFIVTSAYGLKTIKVNKLLPFKRTLVLTHNSDIITHLDGLEELNCPDNDADIKGCNSI